MNLTKNFTLAELTKSQQATRLGLSNEPTLEHQAALKALCVNVLQPARDALGPLTVNSGYRSAAVNHAVGGSATSQHSKGEAADIEGVNVTNFELAKWIANNCMFDQLILEGFDGTPRGGWVHVSYKNGYNRKQILTATFKNGQADYSPVKLESLK